MISRVAESCFWLHRYVERVQSTARMLEVNRAFVLDVATAGFSRWRPMVAAAGEEQAILAHLDAAAIDDDEAVQSYLTWDERCPASMLNSLRYARENARQIRDTLSHDVWEALNSFWLWLSSRATRQAYARQRQQFYERVKEACLLFDSVCHNSMLHEEPYVFMRLGMRLERVSQTARILDVHHHALDNAHGEEPAGTAQWLAILRSCSAGDAFLRKNRRPISGAAVAEFLLLEGAFPQTVRHSLERALALLEEIAATGSQAIGARSRMALGEVVDRLRSRTMERILEDGLHHELTWIVNQTAVASAAIQADYFNPQLVGR